MKTTSQNPINYILASLLIFFLASAHAAGSDPVRPSDPVRLVSRIVAVVNNEVITQFELNDRMRIVMQQLKKRGTPLPPQDVLEKQMLERIITDRVQLQLAKETGIRVDDLQLDKTLQRVAQENNLTVEAFRDTLEKDGVSFAKFREEIRDEIILGRLREREVENRITVSDGEVESFLNSRAAQTGGEDEFNLAQILVRVPEQASPEQIQSKRAYAEKAWSELKKVDFAQVAASYSDAPDALQGGVLGWRAASRLPTLFLETVNGLKPGEISAVLRSPNGFHILKLIDKRSKGGVLIVQKTHARHILIKTSEIVSETDAKNRIIQLKERVDNGANFAELARLHSEDGSASKGGDLGWLSPGETVPEFERAMDALKPGEISVPVKSPFGWHLIQVLERRSEDVSKERQTLMARQEIRARKADEAYENWLRQLRDQAFVEYRLEDK
ncbi:MAG: molecular chaperone SurA [Betaproteobacteria bacterium CG2_30_59_46]|nr:MAG: molecular chaperone SurA [Betaproteobacteria bacterium CG2_30_59_46]PIQ13612.1 MAG: molecular chaperone SurA [Hydrogenophilales bacterium CG18_big_fil_WC_8_21_14_2_50_58_12]PIY00772.1 MAG: molecular chaperone SurA [Hydrogenophilales bacterium CG_4_10_14_3_um_filter_58_23]PJB07837.1 MAG: molecular chaperone SurA [Hydrogenophilales bacterium CG_4_9_14_3_um_filter_59_35]